MLFAASKSFAGTFESRGEFELFAATMPAQQFSEVTKNNAGARLDLDAQYLFNQQWSFKFHPLAEGDGATLSPEEKTQFEVQDFSLNWKKSSRKLKLGMGTVNWEGTDFINPMSLIQAKNWTDPLNQKTKGSAGLYYSDQVGSFSWDLVFIPQQTLSTLPGEKSAWWPRHLQLPTENSSVELRIPDQVEYAVESAEVLDQALANNGALRLQYHGEGFEWSLAGAEAVPTTPFLLPTVDVTPIQVSPTQIYQLHSPIRIKPLYFRQQVFAAAFVYTLKSWIFRLAAQSAQPIGTDFRLPARSSTEVLAIEKTFNWSRSQNITLLLQIAATQKSESENLSLISSLLERSVMFGWRWPFYEKATWTTAFFQEQRYFSSYFHNEISWAFSDRISIQMLMDFFTGSSQSVLGIYEDNDRYMLKLKYAF